MSAASKDRFTPVKSILVSQPKPTEANSPYLLLAEKYKLKIDFRQFIKVEPVPPKEFRKQKIEILKHTLGFPFPKHPLVKFRKNLWDIHAHFLFNELI